MRTTRLVLLASLLVAMIFATGQALAGIPNVELITALAFVSGYLLGPALGAAVGAAGMGAHSLFNVMGAVAPPVWLAQVACFALVGCAGGLLGPVLARARGRVRAAALAAAVGALLVLVYQLVVNVVAFYTFANDVEVWVYVWGGVAFGAMQVAWNAAFFAVAMPPMLRVLARHRRELRAGAGQEGEHPR
ncbi:MAG TPA: hypothetical protein VEC56_10845 [Candidatus Krumholzibacteria bacterium]|nr:hypothetical protein [Candidatus Krumholzibacteria bacterium]